MLLLFFCLFNDKDKYNTTLFSFKVKRLIDAPHIVLAKNISMLTCTQGREINTALAGGDGERRGRRTSPSSSSLYTRGRKYTHAWRKKNETTFSYRAKT
uniref:Uncharacterized protein n=1 Tax=Rhipicephalus zambeziensis TaxID=60191 RepID=A0A224Y6S5_9ACAR